MAVLETVALNLAATGLAQGGSRGSEKIREILRRRAFSSDLDELETEFNRALRDRVTEAVAESSEVSAATIEQNWSDIAMQLNEVQILFDSEDEAVRRIAAAIATGIRDEAASTAVTGDELEHVVAGVYKDVIRSFEKRISGTKLADTLSHEADIELATRVNEVASQLEQIERRRTDVRDAALRDAGFLRLSDAYFDQQTPDPPERCWRTGFELSEVNAGYAVTRESQGDDAERYEIAAALLSDLRDETDCVVLGPPGSGKSTICKQVACRWFQDGYGDTFYRRSDHSKPLAALGTLEERIRDGTGTVLVVVEDAIREEASAIFELIHEFRHDSQVVFLLDAREGEWHGSDTTLADARLQEIKDRDLDVYTVPRIDERECERIIEHFETTTGVSVADSPTELFEAINAESGVGEVLQLSYHLSFYTSTSGGERLEAGITSLEKSVQNVLETQYEDDDDGLAIRFGTLLNLLNAADIGIHPELLHALAETDEEHRRIDGLLERYEGELVFGDEAAVITDQIEPLRANHEFWSTLYLKALLDRLGSRGATRVFEACLASLFEVLDSEQRRHDINRWFREEMPFFVDFETEPTTTGDALVESIFELGRRQPQLAPLYGSTKFSEARVPAACSDDIEAWTALWRGIMYYHSGEFDSAEREFEQAQRLLDDIEGLSLEKRNEINGWAGNYLGAILRDQGQLDAARTQHQQSKRLFNQIDDLSGVAFSLYNLGKLYWVKSDYSYAKQYLEESLAGFREVGDRRYVSVTLNTIGLVLRDQGDFDEAERRLTLSLENAQAAGDERSEARCLNHLGEVERYRSNLTAAEEYYRRALRLARKVGDKQGESWLVHNLGTLAQKRGKLERALDYFEQSRELDREIGNKRGVAITFNYAATINHTRGEYEQAIENINEGLELVEEVGDRRREAELLKTRGIIAKNRGRFEVAEEYLSDSLGILDAVGDRKWRADVLIELGSVALKRQTIDRAKRLYQEALHVKQDIGDREGEARALGGLGSVAQRRGQYDLASALYEVSRRISDDVDDIEGKAYSLSQLGELAREQHRFEAASDYFDRSQELFATIGDRRRQAQIESRRGYTAYEAGNLSDAQTQIETALDSFRRLDDQFGQARALSKLSDVARARGRIEEADDRLTDAIAAFERVGATQETVDHLEQLIELREERGAPVASLQTRVQRLRVDADESES